MNDNVENDPRLFAIPDIHGHAKGEHKAFSDERPIPLSARMLFLWFYHACRRGWPRFMMVTDHMNYLTFEDPAAINLVRRALKLAQAGDLYGAAETASVDVGHAAVVSDGLRRGMRYSIGAEVDNDPRSRPDAQNIVDAMKPDGMIRSVHFLVIDHPTHGPNWNWPFDNPEFADVYELVGTEKTWELYMAALLDAIERLPGNIVGHFYVPALFGHWPDDATLDAYENALVDACEARGFAVEFNTRFLYRDHSDEEKAKYLAAHRRLLTKCKAKNVGIAVGSDAHSPKDQGGAFGTVLALLDECEINELVFPIGGRLARVALRVERKVESLPESPAAPLEERKAVRKSRATDGPARETELPIASDESAPVPKAKSRPKRSRAKPLESLEAPDETPAYDVLKIVRELEIGENHGVGDARENFSERVGVGGRNSVEETGALQERGALPVPDAVGENDAREELDAVQADYAGAGHAVDDRIAVEEPDPAASHGAASHGAASHGAASHGAASHGAPSHAVADAEAIEEPDAAGRHPIFGNTDLIEKITAIEERDGVGDSVEEPDRERLDGRARLTDGDVWADADAAAGEDGVAEVVFTGSAADGRVSVEEIVVIVDAVADAATDSEAADQAAPDHAHAAVDHAVADHAHAAADHAAADHAAADHAAADHAAADHAAADHAAADQVSADRVAADQVAADRSAEYLAEETRPTAGPPASGNATADFAVVIVTEPVVSDSVEEMVSDAEIETVVPDAGQEPGVARDDEERPDESPDPFFETAEEAAVILVEPARVQTPRKSRSRASAPKAPAPIAKPKPAPSKGKSAAKQPAKSTLGSARKKAPVKKAPAKTASAKTAAAKTASAKAAPAKKAPAKKAAAQKVVAKKAAPKRAAVKKPASKKAAIRPAGGKKSSTKKSAAKKVAKKPAQRRR